ncbi:MAG TPA: sigma-70 family RNA polymerase sigma factor [Actinomycetota bacterium]
MPATHADESETLALARAGDEEAFRLLVEPHRPKLHAHCYRMLGSLHDAEDVLQDALLRAWRGLPGFDGRSAFGTWMYRITTNACLDAIAKRPKRVLPVDYGPPASNGSEVGTRPAGVAWLEPYPDDAYAIEDPGPDARYEQRESIELAFVAALQHLAPRQRAVLILREVLGFSAKEVAEVLGSTPASVNSALQRARKAVQERIPARSQQATVRSLGDERVREIVERFTDAFDRGDTGAILSMLAEDATFSMPPYAGWVRGREAVGRSWLIPEGPSPRLRYLPTRANGQPAVAAYALAPDGTRYVPLALDVLTLRDDLIGDVTAFRSPELFEAFGLPPELAA